MGDPCKKGFERAIRMPKDISHINSIDLPKYKKIVKSFIVLFLFLFVFYLQGKRLVFCFMEYQLRMYGTRMGASFNIFILHVFYFNIDWKIQFCLYF